MGRTIYNEVWQLVTQDEYELPIAQADTPEELGKLTGKTANAIRSAVSRVESEGKKSKWKRIRL